MATAGDEKGLRLLRIRLLRPPPSWIELDTTRKAASVHLELALGIQDDYGVDVASFDAVELKLEVLDATAGTPIDHVVINGVTGAFFLDIEPSRGPFYQLKVNLVFPRGSALPGAIRFKLSTNRFVSVSDDFSSTSTAIMALIGEPKQSPVESWDGEKLAFLGITSGDVQIRKPRKATSEPAMSLTKVQTAFRTIYLPGTPVHTPIYVVERPGNNESTGQRLWDCAIALSAFLSQDPAQLLSPSLACSSATSTPSSPTNIQDAVRPLKKPRVNGALRRRRVDIVELGAGCALVGQVAASLLRSTPSLESEVDSRVMCTDVEVTVTSTLVENLEMNHSFADASVPLSTAILDWGPRSDVRTHLNIPDDTEVTLLGSDILYNPSSHQLLLDTLLSFLQPRRPSRPAQALIAYKPRTEGDGDFFELAKGANLHVERIWRWSNIEIWRLT